RRCRRPRARGGARGAARGTRCAAFREDTRARYPGSPGGLPMSIAFRLSFLPLLALGALSLRAQEAAPIRFRAGRRTYEWVGGWGALPGGKTLGNTHGCIVVDRQDRIYLCTDTEDAVVVFDADGHVLKTWGKELAGGLHGMALVDEGGDQRLLLAHIGRHQVFGATLDGEILWTLDYPKES